MNLKLIGIAVAMLFFVTSSSLINYVFAQSGDVASQMDAAKKAAMDGMNQVKSAMKSGGLKSGMASAKGIMKSSLTSSISTVNNKTNPELVESTKKNLKSQMDTAKGAAETGMNQVKSAMKSGGLKSGMEDAKGVMKSSLTSSISTVNNKTNPEMPKLQNQTAIKQTSIGSGPSADENKMKQFEKMRDNLMHAKFKPNPLAISR